MAMRLLDQRAINDALASIARDAHWWARRDITHTSVIVGFSCRARGSLELSEATLEDSADAVRVLVDVATDLHSRSHDVLRPAPKGMAPLFECPACKLSRPVHARIDDLSFEDCERQAVLWMDLALQRRR